MDDPSAPKPSTSGEIRKQPQNEAGDSDPGSHRQKEGTGQTGRINFLFELIALAAGGGLFAVSNEFLESAGVHGLKLWFNLAALVAVELAMVHFVLRTLGKYTGRIRCLFAAVVLLETAVVFCHEFLGRAPPHKPPVFMIVSSPIDLPAGNGSGLSVASIKNRMRRTVEITNPNNFPIVLAFQAQVPEAILSVRSQAVSEATPAWDEQPVTVKQIGDSNLFVEPILANERTGLWRFKLKAIPPNTAVALEVVTATGQDGGVFSDILSKSHVGNAASNSLNWFFSGACRPENATPSETTEFLVPLVFDSSNRSISAGPSLTGAVSNVVELRQGRGFRVPGIFKSKGYLLASMEGRFSDFACPAQMESTNRIADLQIGLFSFEKGKPLEPGILLKTADGSELRIGIGTK